MAIPSDPFQLERLTKILAERESNLLDFWRYSQDIHCIVTGDFNVKSISPAVAIQLGYSPEELEGHSIFEWVHPDDVAFAENIFKRVQFSHESLTNRHINLRHSDGHYVKVELTTSPPINGSIYITARVIRTKHKFTSLFPSDSALKQTA